MEELSEVKVEKSQDDSVKQSSSSTASEKILDETNEIKEYVKDFNKLKKVKISGWVILIGDAFHNFAGKLIIIKKKVLLFE